MDGAGFCLTELLMRTIIVSVHVLIVDLNEVSTTSLVHGPTFMF